MSEAKIVEYTRRAVSQVRRWPDTRNRVRLALAYTHLCKAFSECNRLGRHDLRARVCRMRNWVSAELARAKR